MNRVKLLDCTLRDGGFTNDWNFGLGTIKSIISRLDKANVDVIEIGFIDDRSFYEPNRSKLPDTASFATALNGLNIQNSQIAAMIDYGTCSLENVEPKSETNIDIIRVIFKQKDIDAALAYCDAIQKKGYIVSVQPVSVTSYTESQYIALIEKINKIKPYSVAIVDTYGLMHNAEVIEYFKLLDKYLLPECNIGFHAHNNFQMAYANCISLLQTVTSRTLIIDGSLYGMGKGAGNAPIELLAQYFNENCKKSYDISQMLEAIDIDIMKEYAKSPWGYSLKYFIAASNDCHPDFVKVLMDKKTLSVKSINEILVNIPSEKKLTFHKELIETLYEQYQNNEVDDREAYIKLAKELSSKQIVILAPGKSIEDYKSQIAEYINKKDTAVFSINFLHEGFPIDYVFMGNPKRYSQFFHKMYGANSSAKVMCTSNITSSAYPIDFRFNFAELHFAEKSISDNPVLMLLRILSKIGITDVLVAGFDGYSKDDKSNYYKEYVDLLFCGDDVQKRNEIIKAEFSKIDIELNFITPTSYK